MKTTLHHPCGTAGVTAGARTLPDARRRLHTPARYPVGASRQSAEVPEQAQYFEELHPAAAPAAVPVRAMGRPRVLHVDADAVAAKILVTLLAPEAQVTAAATLAEARALLATDVFSLVVLDPALPDGDGRALLPLLGGTPLLVHCATQPEFRGFVPAYLPKPWTSARQLWVAVAGLLGIPASLSAGD